MLNILLIVIGDKGPDDFIMVERFLRLLYPILDFLDLLIFLLGDGQTSSLQKVSDLLVIESEVDSGDIDSVNMNPLMQKVYELLTTRNLIWVHRNLRLISTIFSLKFLLYLCAELKVEGVVTGLEVNLVIHLADSQDFNHRKE